MFLRIISNSEEIISKKFLARPKGCKIFCKNITRVVVLLNSIKDAPKNFKRTLIFYLFEIRKQ